MDDDQPKQNNLVETTDCLEAVGVFRGWKNFLFVIVILCLILLQVSFWLVNTGYIKAETEPPGKAGELIKHPPADTPPPEGTPPPAKDLTIPLGENLPKQPVADEGAAGKIVGDPNELAEAASQEGQGDDSLFGIGFKHLTWAVRFINFVVVLAATLYCLTMLFTLKVSLLGRLGGINHICRAFFLSLVMVILLLPWQLVFGRVVAGALYTPCELASSYAAAAGGIFEIILYYLRFTGYWVLVVLLLILSQSRSSRWTKATLRRLEVI